jgi:type VI secretion system secreted protein Hcp
MAINAYLEIKGIKGASQIKQDAIDVLSASTGVHNAVSIQVTSQEMKSGRANLTGISFMKASDKSSSDLFIHCATGKMLDEATLVYLKQDKSGKQTPYFKIKLQNVYVSSYQVSGSGEDMHESVVIEGAKMTHSYNPEEKGEMKGFIDKTFDATKNEEA